MTATPLSFAVKIASFAAALFASLPAAQAAGFSLGDAAQFAVLSQFANNQLNFNNGTITGDIGLGSPRQFTISNGSVNGNIRFSGAGNTTGLTPDPDPGSNPGPFTVSGGGTVTGGVFVNDPFVTSALNWVNINLSQTLGGEAGTALTLTSSQTILASSGILDGSGNRVFGTTSVNLNNASTLTISGSASDYVVINVTDNNPAFNGKIVLTGGITSDQVLFNMFGGDYTTHTGGPTLAFSSTLTGACSSTTVSLTAGSSVAMSRTSRLFPAHPSSLPFPSRAPWRWPAWGSLDFIFESVSFEPIADRDIAFCEPVCTSGARP
jgi:hypothetical protein